MTDTSEKSTHQETGSRALANASPQIRRWIKAYQLVLAVIAFSLCIAFVALVYQAGRPAAESRYQAWATDQVTWGTEQAVLSIAYPVEVRLEPSDELRPISVWLRHVTPTVGTAPLVVSPVTPTITSTLVVTSRAMPVMGAIATPTPTLRPWIVSFEPYDNGLLFTDKDGAPTAPQVVLTPGTESAAAAVLYVRRAPVQATSTPAPVVVAVYAPDGQRAAQGATTLQIGWETSRDAFWRRLLGLLLGPTTPFLGMATALGAFALQLWIRNSEQQQREREDQGRRTELEEVNTIESLLGSQPVAALNAIVRLTSRGLQYEDSRNRLAALRDTPQAKDAFVILTRDSFGQGNYETARLALQQIPLTHADHLQDFKAVLDNLEADGKQNRWTALSTEQVKSVRDALYALQQNPDKAVGARAAQLLRDLAHEFGWDRKEPQSAIRPEYLNRLGLWPTPRAMVDPSLAACLDRLDLEFNPFGPLEAEYDAHLATYRVDAPWALARGKTPVVLLGPPGSGKTAASLLLSLDCIHPFAYPREPETLPVRYVPSLDGLSGRSRRRHLEHIVVATARTVASYVAHWDEAFLTLPTRDRFAIVHLLCFEARSPEHVAAQLSLLGPEEGPSERLLAAVRGLYHPARLRNTNEQELLDCLGNARPAGFGCTYLLVDVPGSLPAPDKDTMQQSLSALIDLIAPLAVAGVYAKLFLPDALAGRLGDLGPCPTHCLEWPAESLAEMLEARIRAAGRESGVESLMQLCGPDVPGGPDGIDDADQRLVKAANGSPRTLVQLGNKLLAKTAQRGTGSKFLAEDLDEVLGPLIQDRGL